MASPVTTPKSYLPDGNPFATRPAANSTTNSNATKDMFLKLLVSQIKNQDPLNPSDGTQFVAQLAQFTQLEQTLSMSTDLHSVLTTLQSFTSTADGSSGTSGSSGTTGTNNSGK